jgi:2-polyprenyl-6-methoxyphenol hydroxylase-like FAD-dependent oxidoreductase
MAGMSRIIVLGGSVAGLLCGMQLARRGHAVTLLEREPRAAVAPPAEAPAALRPGAPHAVQGHVLLARAAVEIRRALPDVYAALLTAGVGEFALVPAMPAAIADRTPRAGDDDLVTLQARRHTLDRVLVEAAQATPRLDLRFGTAAAGLVLARDLRDPPRVTGVRTAGGEALAADVVVDASGHRTPVPGWLAAHGIDLPVEASDCGLVYFTRHYRLRPGVVRPPLNRVFFAGGDLPGVLVRWFPADNDTAMLAQIVLAEDRLLKAVRRAARFEAVVRAVPTVAPWLECADPISDVFGMGALPNTLRRVVRAGRPLVLGLHLVGDAACTTNPLLGRGVSMAAVSVAGLVRALAAEPHDPAAQALRVEDALAREIEPSFRENAEHDRAVAQRLRADLTGEPPPDSPPPADDALWPEELLLAGMQDADLYRAWMRYAHLLADDSLLSDPAVVERARRLVPPETGPPAPAGLTRAELAQILATA